MVHFFGIFDPGEWERNKAEETPTKANFFGGFPEAAVTAVPVTRAEQDACFLYGKAPEPEAILGETGRDGKPET